MDARSQAIYFFEQDRTRLRLDDDGRAPPHEAALALQAARTRDIAEEPIERGALRMAAPIYGQSDRAGPVLAAAVLELGIANRYEQQAARRVVVQPDRPYLASLCIRQHPHAA